MKTFLKLNRFVLAVLLVAVSSVVVVQAQDVGAEKGTQGVVEGRKVEEGGVKEEEQDKVEEGGKEEGGVKEEEQDKEEKTIRIRYF